MKEKQKISIVKQKVVNGCVTLIGLITFYGFWTWVSIGPYKIQVHNNEHTSIVQKAHVKPVNCHNLNVTNL